jgi:hypothetical protein
MQQQPGLEGHPTGKQILQVAAGAAAALFAALVADGKKPS